MPIHALLSDPEAEEAYGYVEKALSICRRLSITSDIFELARYFDGQIAIFPTQWGGIEAILEIVDEEPVLRLHMTGPTINVFDTAGSWRDRLGTVYGAMTDPPSPPNNQTSTVEEGKYTGYPNLPEEDV